MSWKINTNVLRKELSRFRGRGYNWIERSPCDSRDSCKSCLCRSTSSWTASSPEKKQRLEILLRIFLMDFTKVLRVFLLKYFSANFKYHLLLDDFVLLGVLREAFRCTFQVPEVNQPVQSAPDDNTWWSSTSAILNISALRWHGWWRYGKSHLVMDQWIQYKLGKQYLWKKSYTTLGSTTNTKPQENY